MKKLMILLLAFLLLLPVAGCRKEPVYEEPLTFYYRKAIFDYEADCSAVETEIREGADYESLEETIAIYLAGPVNPELANPFPAELKLLSAQLKDGTLYLTFSDTLAEICGWDLTLCCCCITLTCLELTDASQVCIAAESATLNGEKNITMNRDCLILVDSTQ